jgi:hypothetical protein
MNVSVRHSLTALHSSHPSTLTPQITQKWDNVTACAKGRDPESTGTFRPSFAPQFDAGDAVRVGLIIGVVTSCTILTLVLIATGIWYFVRRRRQRRLLLAPKERPSSATYLAEQKNGRYSAVAWTPDTDKRFYVRALPHLPRSFLSGNQRADAVRGPRRVVHAMLLQDPADPSTYPDPISLSHSPGSPAAINSASSGQGLTPPGSATHHQREYSGLPEI